MKRDASKQICVTVDWDIQEIAYYYLPHRSVVRNNEKTDRRYQFFNIVKVQEIYV